MATKEDKKKRVATKEDNETGNTVAQQIDSAADSSNASLADNEAIDIIILNDPDNNKDVLGKQYIRQYSLETHGENYKELATGFCTKKIRNHTFNKAGIYFQVPASKISHVEVRYREKRDADLHIDRQDPNAPIVEKVKQFGINEKNEAVVFANHKTDSTVVVSRKKFKKDE